MKLLSLKIGSEKRFRSLPPSFEIIFHTLQEASAMSEFRPFCFAGLNGSGKSNVLEALANIFYHLEICAARYLPNSIRNENNFDRKVCSPDSFQLEYLIGAANNEINDISEFQKVRIIKSVGSEPEMYIKSFPFSEENEEVLIPFKPDLGTDKAAPAKSYLPDHVIGYSSGENEILSLPFIKSRLVHLDEFKQATVQGEQSYTEPENSLIYINNKMSQAVLLACLLFENKETLEPLLDDEDGVGIIDLSSFRMNINLHDFRYLDDKQQVQKVPIIKIIELDQIEKLKKCSSFWYEDGGKLILDFYVNPSTKDCFKKHFNSSFELFQFFRLLYELNSHFISEEIKEDVYQSKGFYTDGKLPEGSPDDNVFYFLNFKIFKRNKETGESNELLLREFSDGEHQFLHTMGICLLLKKRRALLLLDEPETHFNPAWRAKFIKILNESITKGGKSDESPSFNPHYLKDIIITSHSPFIISDCLPHNVTFFKKDSQTKKIQAKKASDVGINTYGSSVDYILKNVFKTKMISNQSYEELKKIITDGTIEELRGAVDHFGESSEKQFLFKRIFELTDFKDDNTTR